MKSKTTSPAKVRKTAAAVVRAADGLKAKYPNFLDELNHQVRWSLEDRAKEGAAYFTRGEVKVSWIHATGRHLLVAYTNGQTAIFLGLNPESLQPSPRNDVFIGYVVPTGASRFEALAYAAALKAVTR